MVVRPGVLAAGSLGIRHSAEVIEHLFERYFFDPAWIATDDAQALFRDLADFVETEPDPEEFSSGFVQRFERIGVSQVGLSVQSRSAAQLGRHFDTVEIGDGAVGLDWHGTVASLSIRTLMGVDTGPRITAAFEEITSNGATGLIIDLRDNPGGSFSMRHVVGHCIPEPTDAGMLLGRAWYAENAHVPDPTHIETLMPWHGTSLVSLWRHLSEHPVTRVQFLPMRPIYEGPIAVLISRHTASAAEIVAEILRTARAGILVGEQSAGAMLVQRPFDVGDLFTLSLPVADYISHGSGRIEGSGLVPDICAVAEETHSAAVSSLVGSQTMRGETVIGRCQSAETGLGTKAVP
ncbi:MAG: S41 family peptidase [Pseudomonadota bacterium]